MRVRIKKGTVKGGRPPNTWTASKGEIVSVPDEVALDLFRKGVAVRVRREIRLGLDLTSEEGQE